MKDLSDIFASQLNKTSKKKPEKKTPNKKEPPPEKKQKITPPPADAEYERMLAEAMGEGKKGNDDSGVDPELEEKSYIAKLEQEISKAEIGKYKAEQERLKLKRAAGDVMEFDRGDMLFFGFIEKGSIEALRVMDKFEPVIKNLVAEGDYKSIKLVVNRELENIFTNIQEEQATTVEDWQKGLK